MQHVSHVLITGGGTGIGLAIARSFVAQGASVTILGRKAVVLAEARAGLLAAFPNAKLGTQQADVTDEAQVQAAFTAATSVVWSLLLTAFVTISLEGYIAAPPTITVFSFDILSV